MPKLATSPPSSRLLEQHYELLDVIATGGQGSVWRARKRQDSGLVAIKLLPERAALDRLHIDRLLRERDALRALEGTAAVRLLDTCVTSQGSPCLVLELLTGRDLEAFLGQQEGAGQRLAFARLRRLLDPVVTTLHHAHRCGIVHRDLKPANIFVLGDESVRVIDFGFVQLKEVTHTKTRDIVMGSPCYIAPEVWLGQAELSDERVDVYALGVIVFRILGGRPPFETQSLAEMLPLATRAARPSLQALRPELPASIDAWVQRALAIDPAARHPDLPSLWAELWEILERSKLSSWASKWQPARVAEAFKKAGELVGRFAAPALETIEPEPAPRPLSPPPPPSSLSPEERLRRKQPTATPQQALPAPRYLLHKVAKVPGEAVEPHAETLNPSPPPSARQQAHTESGPKKRRSAKERRAHKKPKRRKLVKRSQDRPRSVQA